MLKIQNNSVALLDTSWMTRVQFLTRSETFLSTSMYWLVLFSIWHPRSPFPVHILYTAYTKYCRGTELTTLNCLRNSNDKSQGKRQLLLHEFSKYLRRWNVQRHVNPLWCCNGKITGNWHRTAQLGMYISINSQIQSKRMQAETKQCSPVFYDTIQYILEADGNECSSQPVEFPGQYVSGVSLFVPPQEMIWTQVVWSVLSAAVI